MDFFVIELSPEEEALRRILEPAIDGEGFELVKIRFRRSSGRSILSLFVDKKGEVRINVSELENISRFLSDVLDATSDELLMLSNRYELNISSPGLDRPLAKFSHFSKAKGQMVKIRLKDSVNNQKNVLGMLEEVDEDGVILKPPQNDPKLFDEKKILFSEMGDAHVCYQFPEKKRAK